MDSAFYVADTSTIDLPDIRKRGTLKAILTYSSSSYFIYRGTPMGYEYELITRLAKHLNMDLEIIVAPDMDQMASMLFRGDGDIMAHGWTITKNRQKSLAFTEPHNNTRQVLVQRLPDNWRQMKIHRIENSIIRSPLRLIGKTVSVRRNSSYFERIQNLSEEMGGDILIEVVPGSWTTDEIIQKVSVGEIQYTIADQNIARINKTYYNNLDVETAVSFPQRLAWAVRKTSPELLEEVNKWIIEMKKENDYYVIYNKYFKNERAFRKRLKSEFFSKNGDKISEFDPSIKTNAEALHWDWRLLASLIYQESQFNPRTQSWAGAQGLMQVMPATGRDYGMTNLFDPEENIKAGTSFLEYLGESWSEIPDSTERIKFVLASYNAGPGHVADARRLAEKNGK
ncbi:MAG: transporter substrate-binding domain-containing protein, partial [Bacteroidetes bacterium]|nr:transporter substrate-binding domain-containing protein [Bacteroidota bacterium]